MPCTDCPYAILGNEADARDAAQETFVTAWRQLARLRDPDRFDAWFQRVAVNAARMTPRSRRRRRVREIPAAASRWPPLSIPPWRRPTPTVWMRALQRLPLEQRRDPRPAPPRWPPVAELAEVLGIPVGTVKSRLHTARQALQRTLADQEPDR